MSECGGVPEVTPPETVADLAVREGSSRAYWQGRAKEFEEELVMVYDAIEKHLGEFVHDDDVAAVAIYIEAIEKAGERLRSSLQAGSPPQQPEGGEREVMERCAKMVCDRCAIGEEREFRPLGDGSHWLRHPPRDGYRNPTRCPAQPLWDFLERES